jgi:hypothetical protein
MVLPATQSAAQPFCIPPLPSFPEGNRILSRECPLIDPLCPAPLSLLDLLPAASLRSTASPPLKRRLPALPPPIPPRRVPSPWRHCYLRPCSALLQPWCRSAPFLEVSVEADHPNRPPLRRRPCSTMVPIILQQDLSVHATACPTTSTLPLQRFIPRNPATARLHPCSLPPAGSATPSARRSASLLSDLARSSCTPPREPKRGRDSLQDESFGRFLWAWPAWPVR